MVAEQVPLVALVLVQVLLVADLVLVAPDIVLILAAQLSFMAVAVAAAQLLRGCMVQQAVLMQELADITLVLQAQLLLILVLVVAVVGMQQTAEIQVVAHRVWLSFPMAHKCIAHLL